MTWFRVDDSFCSHPKAEEASLAAIGLWAVAGSWCGRHLTDGDVPDHVARRLSRGAVGLADELVSCGLWRRTKSGYRFHQWSERNPTRQEATTAREKKAMGGTLGAHGRWHAKNGRSDPDCPHCQGKHDGIADGMTHGSTHTGTHADVNAPDPTLPKKKQPPQPPQGGGGDDLAFAEFWAAYPRRVGKPKAAEKWRAVLKLGHDPTQIIDAARRYAAERNGQDPKYTPHPATWLHQQRYLDEQPKREIANLPWWLA